MLWKDFSLELDREKLYRRIGYRKGVPDDHKQRIERCLEEVVAVARPGCVYNYFDVRCSDTGIYVAEDFLESSFLVEKFSSYDQAVLFVCTAGFELKPLGGDMLEQFCYYGIGVEMVEGIAGQLNKKIAEKKGTGEVKRWSPGYNDWDLEDQKKIFGLLRPEQIGVTLTEGFMMEPEFSVSAIIRYKK